jgi:hypothetical protein
MVVWVVGSVSPWITPLLERMPPKPQGQVPRLRGLDALACRRVKGTRNHALSASKPGQNRLRFLLYTPNAGGARWKLHSKPFCFTIMCVAQIIDIKTRKVVLTKTIVTREEFCELADKVLSLVPNNKMSRDLIVEMKWDACYNDKFRNKTYPELKVLYEVLRARTGNKVLKPK